MTDYTFAEPCPSCGGQKFRAQELQYAFLDGDESGAVENIESDEVIETVAAWCMNEDCEHYEEPLVDNWHLVDPEDEWINAALDELVDVASLLAELDGYDDLADRVIDQVDTIDQHLGLER